MLLNAALHISVYVNLVNVRPPLRNSWAEPCKSQALFLSIITFYSSIPTIISNPIILTATTNDTNLFYGIILDRAHLIIPRSL